MLQILIAEDDPSISKLVKVTLEKAGYGCTCAEDGLIAADLLDTKAFDLILLDVMLPGADGFQLMEYIRPLGVPVIFLTAKAGIPERIKGLRLGAEDYVTKPFDIYELLARVEVVCRRYHKTQAILTYGDLSVDTEAMVAKKAGQPMALTRTEFDLLLLFLRNVGFALPRESIYSRIWGGELPPGSKAVDFHIQNLRKKLGLEACLKAVPSVGYRLEVNRVEIP